VDKKGRGKKTKDSGGEIFVLSPKGRMDGKEKKRVGKVVE